MSAEKPPAKTVFTREFPWRLTGNSHAHYLPGVEYDNVPADVLAAARKANALAKPEAAAKPETEA